MAVAFSPEEKNMLRALWNQFWVVRDNEPGFYRQIVERKKKFQRYFQDRFGLQLIVNRYFVRLEKLPSTPESWMGIEDFQSSRDYALFACIMAFLEEKNIEEQFLLSGLCETLPELYPHKGYLDWTHYEHRKSLVRALQKVVELELLKVIEGEVEGFRQDEGQEVLYEVTVLSRYFLPTFPRELQDYGKLEDFNSLYASLTRKQILYGRLFLSPVLTLEEAGPDLFEYLRRYARGLQEDIENTSDFELEIYRDVAFLNLVQNPGTYKTYPDNRGISHVALHFALVLNEKKDECRWEQGKLQLTLAEWEGFLQETRDRFGHGWSKDYRESRLTILGEKLIEYLEHWKMVHMESQRGLIHIYSPLLRISGRYPANYTGKEVVGDGGL